MARGYRMNPGSMGKAVVKTTTPEPKPKTRTKKKKEEPRTEFLDSETLDLEDK